MLYIDIKYANMLAPRLRNFKHKNEYLWNFSCPVCGDSSKNKLKARGYIYKVKTGLFVKCHNCNYGTNIGNLIKYLDPVMYEEYVLENYKESGAPRSHHKDAAIAIPDILTKSTPLPTISILSHIKCLDTLPADHPALKYVIDRKIPSKYINELYYAPRFMKYVNIIQPGKFKTVTQDHPRLIIPYFNKAGKCFAVQGRAFGKEDPKYFTIKVDENEEKIFGLDRVDETKRIYIVEGPLDSLFLSNAIAVSGASFSSPTIEKLKSNATVVYDNEPRSKELTKLISKTIEQGFSVCLWPEAVVEKDVNEMVLAGRTPEEVQQMIDANTFSGAEAQLRFASWRKC